jgi:hypothetical protein
VTSCRNLRTLRRNVLTPFAVLKCKPSKETSEICLALTACPQILLLKKDGSPYFRALKSKYEENHYEDFYLLILVIFLKISTTVFKILYFEFSIS